MRGCPLGLKFTQSSQRVLKDEKRAIEDLDPDDPNAFANNPRVIAFIALDRLLNYCIITHYKLYSRRVPSRFVPDAFRSLRCAETFGWRLIVKLTNDNQNVELVDLSRVERNRQHNLRKTLERLFKPAIGG